MALGYVDPESGTYFYGSDDPNGPMHDVLNNAALAEHNARLADRARLDELARDVVPAADPGYGVKPGYVMKATSGIVKVGSMNMLSFTFTRDAQGTVPANTWLFNIPYEIAPSHNVAFAGVLSRGSAGAWAYENARFELRPDGGVAIVSAHADTWYFSGTVAWVN